jgi:hypothetical protein
VDAAGVVCLKLSDRGAVVDAFIAVSTGNADSDRDLVAWVKQLTWPPAGPGNVLPKGWIPMGFGETKPPAVDVSCDDLSPHHSL